MFRKHLYILILIPIIGILTIPRLLINYGMDGDTVLGIKAAEEFRSTGTYSPSRIPGNPLFEYLLTIVVPWGSHITTNILVSVFYVLSIVAFSLLVKEYRVNPILTVIFALTPIILINAVTTIDYVPGLAFMLFSYFFVTKEKYMVASILLGLSIGIRLSNILFIIPFFLFLIFKKNKIFKTVSFLSLSIFTGILFYFPIFIKEGFKMFLIPPPLWSSITYLLRTGYNTLMLFGPIAMLGILLLISVNLSKFLESIKENIKVRSAPFFLEITTIAFFFVLFLIRSDEVGYLIPIIPFVYLFISRCLPKKQLIFVGLLVFSFAFLNIEFKGGESGKRKITFRPTWGIVIKDYIYRNEIEKLRNGIYESNLPEKSIIITGMGPILTYKNDALVEINSSQILLFHKHSSRIFHKIKNKEVFLVYDLPLEDINFLRRQGYNIYMFSEFAPTTVINKYGYDPYQIGIMKLEILNENAFYKK